jgi:methyltransferase
VGRLLIFYLVLAIIIIQRLAELRIARSNELWMKSKGALEFGQKHYKLMVMMHTLFFVALLAEVIVLKRGLSPYWPALLILFLVTQGVRVWALSSLGRFWNTKIIVLPNANIVRKGPYRFIKHPNYVIVTIELIVIPLLFQAYITAGVFTLLNAAMLYIRIPAEEKALKQLTEYDTTFKDCNRFVPELLKKYDS